VKYNSSVERYACRRFVVDTGEQRTLHNFQQKTRSSSEVEIANVNFLWRHLTRTTKHRCKKRFFYVFLFLSRINSLRHTPITVFIANRKPSITTRKQW